MAGVKLYPAGATTNSAAGVRRARWLASIPPWSTMAEVGLPLLVHGEVTDPDVDIFDREARFLTDVLEPILARYPALRVVVEHATKREPLQTLDGQPIPTQVEERKLGQQVPAEQGIEAVVINAVGAEVEPLEGGRAADVQVVFQFVELAPSRCS